MQIFMVVGCPCSGKSWVCDQLREQFHYVRHDDFIGANYVSEIVRQYAVATKPLLIETPFSMSQIIEPLERHALRVTCVFILEQLDTLRRRYREREGKDIPAGHLVRQATYARRAIEGRAFYGTSSEVLAHLKTLTKQVWPWGA